MVTDTDIINMFFGERQIKWQVYKKYINYENLNTEQEKEIFVYLNNRFTDNRNNLKETLYRIKFGIEQIPICPICGKQLPFVGKLKGNRCYNGFCSDKCAQNSPEVRKKRLLSSISKYGAGCNIQKVKQTCLEKYGVDNVYKTDWCIEKIKETTFSHYGVTNYMKTGDYNKKTHSKEVNEKRNNTKRNNGTFNSSKPENLSYKLLKEKFDDVIYQYKSKEYPFICDFYIPSLKLYIECNYHWTHGFRPFNEKDNECIRLLNQWKEGNTKYYNNAINTWTVRDVQKRKVAMENSLNYKEFWNIDELKEFIYEQK